MPTPEGEQFHDFSVRPLQGLDEMLACSEAKNAILGVFRHPGVPPKLSILGPPGSGKTTLVREGIRLVSCEDPRGLRPCGGCAGCQAYSKSGGMTNYGMLSDSDYEGCQRAIDLISINCRSTTSTQIRQQINALKGRTSSLRIIHLEEVGSLYKDRRDETITDLMDDAAFKTCRWISTAVTDEELDEQFRRRWNLKVRTTPPDPDALAEELARRCGQFRIMIDRPSTWRLSAERSRCIVGRANCLLAMALMNNPSTLTEEMVRQYPFPRSNPWKD